MPIPGPTVATFAPVLGRTYTLGNMDLSFRGVFRGFVKRVREAKVGEKTVYPPEGGTLLLFEAEPRQPGQYRYAAVLPRVFVDSHSGQVTLSLIADHFGNTIEEIDRHGPQPKTFFKLVDGKQVW